ncbi:uncharacterized protein BJ171DRAFT_500644 [Polychytrium aggregatum]|uniref:uncharacterized protein n=1 Tax=Polychytrium aggregatum TaxID=110093 RepID=UPI0022FE9B76|nr:uncharacterized protein BJ171DRAFT_500644 [Polychytrium aggregatum]KAI9205501.1 hypothetical protein BJ171DRAFT_500644 [Polychytrium aggregatum]
MKPTTLAVAALTVAAVSAQLPISIPNITTQCQTELTSAATTILPACKLNLADLMSISNATAAIALATTLTNEICTDSGCYTAIGTELPKLVAACGQSVSIPSNIGALIADPTKDPLCAKDPSSGQLCGIYLINAAVANNTNATCSACSANAVYVLNDANTTSSFKSQCPNTPIAAITAASPSPSPKSSASTLTFSLFAGAVSLAAAVFAF